jgi:transcriptional regulator with XRE-family HTH domain
MPRGLPLPHLEAWRLSQALTQGELAEAAGLARNTIVRAEAGGSIALGNVRKLAAALGISVQQLLTQDPSKIERAA